MTGQRVPARRVLLGLLAGAATLGSPGAMAQPAGAPSAPPAPPAPPPELAADLPGAAQRGSAVMRFIGLQIYDIRLWSPAALPADTRGQPLALELIYARKLVGELIASQVVAWSSVNGPMRRISSMDRLAISSPTSLRA